MSVKSKIKRLKLKKVNVCVKTLRDQDWLTKWKDDSKPYDLTDRLMVVPTVLRKKYKPRKKEFIYLDSGLAFGTGLHATTRFMVQFIEKCNGKFESFLDVGTGSGILSIVAYKNGAHYLEAIDIKKDAIKVAKENFATNQCTIKRAIALSVEKYKPKDKFDYVAANLITHDLIASKRKLLSLVKKNKYLAVSGISVVNYPLFRSYFDKLPLRCLKIEKSRRVVCPSL